MAGVPLVAICTPTRGRPEGLARLLQAVEALTFDDGYVPHLRMVVVDNDPAESAREFVGQWRRSAGIPVTYQVEPRPGVAHVRNTAVAAALAADADLIAFIDDDERPTERWLAELLAAQRQFRADIVTGPVMPEFMSDVPWWLRESGFLRPLTGVPGQARTWAASGNVLIRRHVFDRLGGFHPSYGLTGGEDVLFFRSAAREGSLIVWAEQAVAFETVTAERLRLRWHLQRAMREGNLSARIHRDLEARPVAALVRFGQDAKTVLRGLVGGGVVLLLGRRGHALRALRTACAGAGGLAAFLGLVYEQYGDHPGRWTTSKGRRSRTSVKAGRPTA